MSRGRVTGADLVRRLEAAGVPGVSPAELRAFLEAHRAELEAEAELELGPLFDRYQPALTPGPRDRGHRPLAAVAAELVARGVAAIDDPDIIGVYQLGEQDEDEDVFGMTYVDLPDLLGVPTVHPKGGRWGTHERQQIAEQVLLAGTQVRDEGLPAWLASVMMEDVMERRTVRLVPVPREVAADFISRHHSKLPDVNERGWMYALGAVSGSRLVAVATAGSPTGRWSDPHRVLELTRVASDRSVKGAASALVARLIDLLPRSVRPGAVGLPLFVTYSLTSEQGTTYRALKDKGLRPVALVRERAKGAGGGSRATGALAGYAKVRWEAGPGAGAADWPLLSGGHHA